MDRRNKVWWSESLWRGNNLETPMTMLRRLDKTKSLWLKQRRPQAKEGQMNLNWL